MFNFKKCGLIAAGFGLVFSMTVSAADGAAQGFKPESYAFAKSESSNQFLVYSVQCADSSQALIRKTVGTREWCNAEGCSYRMIKTAQEACNDSQSMYQPVAVR